MHIYPRVIWREDCVLIEANETVIGQDVLLTSKVLQHVERGNVEDGRSERQGIGFLIRQVQRLGSEQEECL